MKRNVTILDKLFEIYIPNNFSFLIKKYNYLIVFETKKTYLESLHNTRIGSSFSKT